MLNTEKLKHVGIIMDGNRRWAKKRLLSSSSGHNKGAKVFKQIAKYANKIGLKHLTFYAFSTENWKRKEDEISYLMILFKNYLKDVLDDFEGENMKIQFLGNVAKFSNEIQILIQKIENGSKNNNGMVLNIAMNYGSREEILNAVAAAQILKEKIDEEKFSELLYTKGQPNIDLIIRTGGDQRISNFMLWQSAYAELLFLEKLWPEFDTYDFDEAINIFNERRRNFGR